MRSPASPYRSRLYLTNTEYYVRLARASINPTHKSLSSMGLINKHLSTTTPAANHGKRTAVGGGAISCRGTFVPFTRVTYPGSNCLALTGPKLR